MEEEIEEPLILPDIEDTPEEISDSQQRAQAVLTAILEFKRPLNQRNLLGTQNTSVLNTIINRDTLLNTHLQEWIKTGSPKADAPDEIRKFINSMDENSTIGNPSTWPVRTRLVLSNRVDQLLKSYHFTDSLEHVERLMKNTKLQLE